MDTIVNLYSDKPGEIPRFLSNFYNDNNLKLDNDLKWENRYSNSIEIVDIIGAFIDNKDNYKINMWISLDEGLFINVTENNSNEIIKYLYERFPY